jgi:Cd2+/Zn2+-exporting ATPase
MAGILSPLAVALLYAVAYAAGGYYGLLDGIAVLPAPAGRWLLMIFAALGSVHRPARQAPLCCSSSHYRHPANLRPGPQPEGHRNCWICAAGRRRPAQLRLVTLPVEKLVLGDNVLVRPGERFPIDGEVTSGLSTADQSTITGESVGQKETGDNVFAGTLNGNGALEITWRAWPRIPPWRRS